MNMRPIILFLVAAFVSIAVFGFAAMNHGQGHGGCIAAAVAGGGCPAKSIAFIDFHAGVFKSFSTALVSGFTAPLASIAVVFLFKIFFQAKAAIAPTAYINRHNFDLQLAPAPLKIFHWIKSHNNSPSLLLTALA